MKSQLAIRINKSLADFDLEHGALAQVRAIDESGRARLISTVSVPVSGSFSNERLLEVGPGRYEISASLPSGSVLSQTVDVKGDETVRVALDAGFSPHEWLAWQHWSGNVSDREATHSLQKSLTSAPERVRNALDDVKIVLWSQTPAVRPSHTEPVWEALSKGLANLGNGESLDPSVLMPDGFRSEVITPLRDPPYLAARLPMGRSVHPGRAYLVISRHERSMLCAMPWPWQQADGSGEALVEAVIAIEEEFVEQKDVESSVPSGECMWSVRPTVRDRMVGGLLAYFAAGEKSTARELLGPARDLLFLKMENPLGAAAGAYILYNEWIRESVDKKGSTDWQGWVHNLNIRFPWLPDGAILDGWLALRSRDQSPRADEARRALLEAERRGIPIYTIGVQMLVDGLLLLSGESKRRGKTDNEVDMALARARRLGWQVDPRQPFTCIRLFTS